MLDKKIKKIIFLEKLLRWMSVAVLKKYNPDIVGITGSVGKTSAKEAVHSVLSLHFRVRKNDKNYNNEIGLPLTIIGSASGENSFLRWLGVFLKWLGLMIFPAEYPEILILEMGADRPGDIKYLTDFIKCRIGIITDISGSHLEYFKTIEKVAEEKWKLLESLPDGSTAVINMDNPKIIKKKNQEKKDKIDFLTFGFSEEADIKAADVFYNYSEEESGRVREIRGLSFKLNYKGTTIPVRLNNILAQHGIYAALAGVAVGIIFKLNLVEISKSLENFSMPPGRMKIIAGLRNSLIIDDTYNASPVSTLAALEVMKNLESVRRIAILGDMLELGVDSESEHKKIIEKFKKMGGNILIAVGKRMQAAVAEFEKQPGHSDNYFVFDGPDEAGRKLQSLMQKGDLILIKGSQGMRMEKVVEEVMAEPEKAETLLCRQDESWKTRPWREV